MNKRLEFVNYVKNGGGNICSPQIGAGAGFDSKIAGKEWFSQTSIDDTIDVVQKFDILPLINIGLCDLGECNPQIAWKYEIIEKSESKIKIQYTLDTPAGMLCRNIIEEKYKGCFLTKYAIACEDDLKAFEYYIDAAMESDFDYIASYVQTLANKIGNKAALSIQWAMQPYELLCFPNTVDTLMISLDSPKRFKKLMDKIVKLDEKLLGAVSKGGADFVFLGAPGVEMISPFQYDNFIVPYSQTVTSIAHAYNLMIYGHICSPIEPFLSKGYYNKMGIDLFETLSPPPVGNIISLEDAFAKIDIDICTRGNLGLDVLVTSNPDKVKEEVYKIIEAAKGRKHIVAASDYLFYQVHEENIHAMCEAVREYSTR